VIEVNRLPDRVHPTSPMELAGTEIRSPKSWYAKQVAPRGDPCSCLAISSRLARIVALSSEAVNESISNCACQRQLHGRSWMASSVPLALFAVSLCRVVVAIGPNAEAINLTLNERGVVGFVSKPMDQKHYCESGSAGLWFRRAPPLQGRMWQLELGSISGSAMSSMFCPHLDKEQERGYDDCARARTHSVKKRKQGKFEELVGRTIFWPFLENFDLCLISQFLVHRPAPCPRSD
jgi:hypothetical protein